jgi:predicted transcriptional regulator
MADYTTDNDESDYPNYGDSNLDLKAHENTAKTFFELGSSQRLAIMFKVAAGGNCNLALLARELNSTMPEVRRNIVRLTQIGLIQKNVEGGFILTTFGKIILQQIPTIDFLSQNKVYFKDHSLSVTPTKFLKRLGSLNGSRHISGLVSTLEKWKEIYSQSQKYVYTMVPEVPIELIESITSKLRAVADNTEFEFNYILPQNAVVPKKRKQLLKEASFVELLREGRVKRKMVDKLIVGLVLNEKQACVAFPRSGRDDDDKLEPDIYSIFYSDDNTDFHEWCLDYFRYNWLNAKSFDEAKLVEV